MSFLIYFFVLLVSAASVLFGLDLMNSPLPNTPNVPIGRSVQVASQPPAQQRQKRAADERALTPVYPTEPGKPKIQTETSGNVAQEQATLTPAPAPPPAANVEQAPLPQPAPAQPKEEPVAATQPAAQQASNSCNVQACGAAYQSFRAADCSYQPADGPRRACTIAGGAATASMHAPKPQQAPRQVIGKDEMRAVERIVKHQPLQLAPPAGQSAGKGEMSEAERIVRRMTRNENADIPVQAADGSIFIVRKSYR